MTTSCRLRDGERHLLLQEDAEPATTHRPSTRTRRIGQVAPAFYRIRSPVSTGLLAGQQAVPRPSAPVSRTKGGVPEILDRRAAKGVPRGLDGPRGTPFAARRSR